MALTYGFLKARIVTDPMLQASTHQGETQYHLHVTCEYSVPPAATTRWDCAINVGTNQADDLLQYQLVSDFAHPIVTTLRAAPAGFNDLTVSHALPALDFQRSDVLANTGPWIASEVMDGTQKVQPVQALNQVLLGARSEAAWVYIFGRKYLTGLGIHDIHMNQGSSGSFLNNGKDDHNDHNDVWQDGGVLVDSGTAQLSAYFAAFSQQRVPTDGLGNPLPDSHPLAGARA